MRNHIIATGHEEREEIIAICVCPGLGSISIGYYRKDTEWEREKEGEIFVLFPEIQERE